MLSPNSSSRSRISRIIIYAIVTSTILLMAAERSNSAAFPFLDSVRELIGRDTVPPNAPGPQATWDAFVVDTFTDLGTANAPFVTYQLSVTKSGTGGGTVTADVGAINCGATCTATYDEGQMVAITATPDSTSHFAGWTGACAGTLPTCIVTMSQNLSVNANFTRNQYLLTVSKTGTGTGTVTSSPAGISCGVSCSANFTGGSSVTLTAAADGTSVFMGWSGGGCSGTGNCIVSMTTPITVTAQFDLIVAPSVTTNVATSVTGSTATLNGAANPNGASTLGWFRYSTASPGTCNDSFGTRVPASGGVALGSGTSVQNFSQPVTGLASGSTYYFCAMAFNAEGMGFGSVLSFTTPSPPTVTTSPANSISITSATLNGVANPNGASSTGWFRYSTISPGTCNDSFGVRSPSTGGSALGAGTTPQNYAQAISGLVTGTTYYFCAIAGNTEGVSFGSVLSFTTLAPPTVTTWGAASIMGTSAVLTGVANPNGLSTTGWYRYSSTNPGICNDSFGIRAPASGGSALGAGTTLQSFDQAITGLTTGTTYYLCAIASNAAGTSFGSVLSFTTSAPPTVTTNAATSITSGGATLNGAANPNHAPTFGYFRYSLTDPGTCSDTFGTRVPSSSSSDLFLGSGTALVAYSNLISGLTPGSTYYYCAIARNSLGTRFGEVLSFSTPANVPAVTTVAATSVTGTTAMLNGSANPGGAATTGWFRYSTISPGTCNDTFGVRAPTSGGSALGAGTKPVAYSQAIAGLSSETTYYYCAIATNSAGTSFGSVLSFTTAAPICTPAPVGLVGWWPGDGATTDMRGTNNGIAEGSLTFSLGKVAQGFNFDGSTADIRVPASSSLDVGVRGGMTIDMWINPTTVTNNPLAEWGSGITGAYFWLGGSEVPGNLYINLTDTGGNYHVLQSPGGIVIPNEWQHVAMTYDPASGIAAIYRNGSIVAGPANLGSFTPRTNADLYLGLRASPGYRYSGLMDEVEIFDRALSAEEIQAIVNAGSSGKCKPTAVTAPSELFGWWGGDGDTRDYSPNALNATQAYGPAYSVGKVGQAFEFDGIAQHFVEVAGNGPPFDPGSAEFSVELWMRSRDSGANTYLVGKSLPDGGEGWDIRLNDNMIRLVGVNGWGFNLDTDASVTPNTWHHVAMSSTTTLVSLYIDGVLKGTCPRSSIIATANPLRFGHTTNYGGPAFNGQMDEIDFFNRAITPVEIMGIYNAGLAGKLKLEIMPANTLAEPQSSISGRALDIPGIQLGDATVTLPIISTGGVTQQIPLDPAKLPPLPMGATPTNLTYDIATSAVWSGTPSVCFNLPALSSVYRNLRILHLENGVWVNRTQVPGANPILCTYGLTSLSPFTIADFGPTAASVSVSGRVMTKGGNGVLNAIVQMTDQYGGTRTARTGTFGYYRFDEVPVGENYVISVASKRFVFVPRPIMVMDELDNVDLVAEP